MIRWNWTPDHCVMIDIETQSCASIRDLGARRYLAHSSTRLMSLVALLPDHNAIIWIPNNRAPKGLEQTTSERLIGPWHVEMPDIKSHLFISKEPPELLCIAAESHTFVAHNAGGFDAPALERFAGLRPTWFDTMPCARAGGYPAGLDKLGYAIARRGKDEMGKNAMLMLSKGKYNGGEPYYNIGSVPLWEIMLRYNIGDVVLLEKVYNVLLRYIEPQALAVDYAINSRGISVDIELAEQLKSCYDILHTENLASMETVTNGEITEENVKSVPQMRAWLRTKGFDIKSLEKKNLELLFESPNEFADDGTAPEDIQRALEALRLRQQIARTGKSKLITITDRVNEDKRIRHSIVYHGALTGRFTGRDMQPHNFARGNAGVDLSILSAVTIDRIKSEAIRLGTMPADVLGTLTRCVLCAGEGKTLLIADYGAIEARCVAWLANEQSLLQQFADPKADIYKDMAARVFGVTPAEVTKPQRFVGKQIILGCGYSMSAPKFQMTCDAYGIDLAAVGTSAKVCVDAYRNSFPLIKQLWKDYHDVVHNTLTSRAITYTGRCKFFMDGNCLCITLPSNRTISYRNARIENRIPGYVALFNMPVFQVPTVVYDKPQGMSGILYGGLITENISQGFCRDPLVDTLIKAEDAGLCPVLHVHDEVICEVDEEQAENALHALARIMTIGPDYAEGFPFRIEGFTAKRYSKVAPLGAFQVDYLGGKEC